jgi:uncharacterized protein
MRMRAISGTFKVWLYAGLVVLLGAWATPLIHNIGKALAEVSYAKSINGPIERLANVCRAADFPDYFRASLVLATGLLFFPLLEWLRSDRAGDGATDARGQRLVKNRRAMRQAVQGFFLAALLLLTLYGALTLGGVYVWKGACGSLGWLALRCFMIALPLAILQELIFRGVVLGIFLRGLRPMLAVALVALLFALVHFLSPPLGVNVLDEDATGTGFELLGKVASQFIQLRPLLTSLAPLLALGGVLGYARWRTASLALPIGLHLGWIFATSFFSELALHTHPGRLLCGSAPDKGLLPLGVILLLGVFMTQLLPADGTRTSKSKKA